MRFASVAWSAMGALPESGHWFATGQFPLGVENRKSAPRNRTTNLNRNFKEKREKFFRKLGERYG